MPRKPVTDKEIVLSGAVPSRRKPSAPKRGARTAPASVAVAEEAPVTQPIPTLPTQQQIAALAYAYWEARGCQGGSPEQDWLRAEQELLATTITASATATA
jgi:Protein of unknown function (DUF2934)